MKTLLTVASSLALAALLLPAQAQTPAATSHDNPTPAKPTAKPTTQRGTAYKQATGATTKPNLGRKFVEKSKPTDSKAPNQPRVVPY